MRITLTAAEKRKTQEIIDSFQPERERIAAAIEAAQAVDDKKELSRLLMQQQVVMESIETALEANFDKMQLKRFKKIAKGGIDAIMSHAEEQIPLLLKDIYRITKHDYNTHGTEPFVVPHVCVFNNGKMKLDAFYAVQALKGELRLHIEALQDNKAELRRLFIMIREATKKSGYTTNETVYFSDDLTPIIQETQEDTAVSIKHKRLPDILKYHIMNDMTALNLVKYNADIDGQMTLVWNVDDKKTEPVAVSLSYDNPNIAYTKKLTEFDKGIIDAVSTLFYHWEFLPENKALPICPPLTITPAYIWRFMNGKDINDHMTRPSPRQIQRICDSMDKLRTTLISIDYIKDLKESGFDVKPGIDRTRQSYMIKADKDIERKNTGKDSVIYIVSEAPFLYRYNKKKGHVLFVDYKLLNITGIEKKKNSTEYMQEFKIYLLRRITLMRRGILSNKHIRLDTIYTETDIKEPARRIKAENYANEAAYKKAIRAEKRRDCDAIRHILGEWIPEFIKGFSEDKEGRGGSVTGFCIDYDMEPIENQDQTIAALDKKQTRRKKGKK